MKHLKRGDERAEELASTFLHHRPVPLPSLNVCTLTPFQVALQTNERYPGSSDTFFRRSRWAFQASTSERRNLVSP